MSTYLENVQKLKAKQEEIVELNRKLENAKQEYCGMTKAIFGLADGDPINILEVVEMVKRVQEMT